MVHTKHPGMSFAGNHVVMRARRLGPWMLVIAYGVLGTHAHAQTPVTGHYPPGQSGLRGASTPDPGFSITNFSRLFSNLQVADANSAPQQSIDERRFANITMFTWRIRQSRHGLLGARLLAGRRLLPER